MSSVAVVPGSFDPITLGHIDVIERAARLFDELHVVVVHNPDKHALIPIAHRVALIEKSLEERGLTGGNIIINSWSVGLLVDYCTDVGASAIVNRNLAGVETIFLLPDPAHAHVSSSLVRQVSALGGDVAPYVPAPVAEFLKHTTD